MEIKTFHPHKRDEHGGIIIRSMFTLYIKIESIIFLWFNNNFILIDASFKIKMNLKLEKIKD